MLARDSNQVMLESEAADTDSTSLSQVTVRPPWALDPTIFRSLGGPEYGATIERRQFRSNTSQAFSLLGLLEGLGQSTILACDRHQNMPAACVLAVLVLSTVPYEQPYISSQDITEKILEPLEEIVGSYVCLRLLRESVVRRYC
jgi:hypothetical protein